MRYEVFYGLLDAGFLHAVVNWIIGRFNYRFNEYSISVLCIRQQILRPHNFFFYTFGP